MYWSVEKKELRGVFGDNLGIIVLISPEKYMFWVLFNSFPASGDLLSADNLYKQFGPRSGPKKRSDQIWIQTV